MRLQLRSNAVNIGLTGTCGVLAFCFSKAESSQVGLSETEPPGHHPCDRSCRAPPPRPAYRSEERQQRLPCACSPRFSPPTGLLGILGGTLLSFLSSTWDDAPSTPQIHTQTLEHTCFLCPQMTSCLDLNVTRGGKLPGPPASQGRAACSVFLAVITPLLTSLCMTSWRISFISCKWGRVCPVHCPPSTWPSPSLEEVFCARLWKIGCADRGLAQALCQTSSLSLSQSQTAALCPVLLTWLLEVTLAWLVQPSSAPTRIIGSCMISL